jgi:Zn-dependent metalloprotease
MRKIGSITFGLAFVLLLAGPGSAGAAEKENGKRRSLDPAGIERLKERTGGHARVSVSEATGAVRFVNLEAGFHGDLMSESAGSVRQKASAFLHDYAGMLGLRDVDAEVRLVGEKADRLGARRLTYEQSYRGVPVFAGMLRAHFSDDGRLVSVNGNLVPKISVNPSPSRSAAEAAAVAIALVSEQNGGREVYARSGVLTIYRTGLARGVDGESYLTWQVEVGNDADVREFVYVDAHTGKFVDQITGIFDAMSRRAYDGLFLPTVPPGYPGSPFWVEGDAFPTAVTEANNMILSSKETYDLYENAFGRDSFDAAGAIMDSIFNRGYSCPNASWNGTFISFCNGLTTDDVTGHEWTHAYTEYTHGLIYQWQPGALNESYSDIFGETIDRINGRDTIGNSATDPLRTAGACSTYTPLPPVVTINSPAAIAGNKPAGTAAFGSQAFTLTNDVVQVNDGVGTTVDGCETPFVNAAAVAGKIAFMDRGTCGFAVKAKNAQLNGAIGAIIGNNQGGTAIVNMGGVDATVTIPSLSVTQNDGTAIKGQLASTTVNAKLSRGQVGTDASTRWLLGEDDTATGLTGALRDMYTPTCYSNPGKVSDIQYGCGTADQGGVHNNSGVPNHAYSLIVDGGTYNGQTISGIGLTKAAHIYFRAMTVYQGPATDFADHADAIEQSASDLVGVDLPDLVTGAASGQVISSADLAQIHKAMLAVEMRTPPTQCNFQPLLGQTPPADPACGALTVKRTLLADDFEGDTSAWSLSHTSPSASFTARDWSVSSSLPDGRAGKAFFGPDPNIGDCGPQNESGVLHLTSPSIVLPAAISSGPTLTFEHWVATEAGWDGGQLRISVNGGASALVPQGNFIYNAHNVVLNSSGAGNTNPQAGQRAWSGTDGGSVEGTWGRSIVNLAGLAAPGDTIQLIWDIGTDGCGGVFGWYVDDVHVYDCEPDADGDGVRDADDLCAASDLQATVVLGTGKKANTGVPNKLLPEGCTFMDKILICKAEAGGNHGQFVSCVSGLTNGWVAQGLITGAQKGAIESAAAQWK